MTFEVEVDDDDDDDDDAGCANAVSLVESHHVFSSWSKPCFPPLFLHNHIYRSRERYHDAVECTRIDARDAGVCAPNGIEHFTCEVLVNAPHKYGINSSRFELAYSPSSIMRHEKPVS
jgi:hypothetical protein